MLIRIYSASLDALDGLLGSSDPRPIARKLAKRDKDERTQVLQLVDLGHALRKLDEDAWLLGLDVCCKLQHPALYAAELRWEGRDFPELNQLVMRKHPGASARYRCDAELGSLNHVPATVVKRLADAFALSPAAKRKDYVKKEWGALRRAVSANAATSGLLTFALAD